MNNENARLGAQITKNGKSFFVYKVNDKSFYCGVETYETIKIRWENKKKGTTWKEFMEVNGGTQEEYGTFELVKVPVQAFEASAKSKKLLTPMAEREITKLYGRYVEDKGKSYMHPVEIGKEFFRIVAANKEKQVLLAIDGNYVIFDLEQGKYTKWREITKKGSSEIPWPKKEIGG